MRTQLRTRWTSPSESSARRCRGTPGDGRPTFTWEHEGCTPDGNERDDMVISSCRHRANHAVVEVRKCSQDERESPTARSRPLPGPGTPVRSALDVNLAPDHLAKPCTTALPLTSCSCSCQIAHHVAHQHCRDGESVFLDVGDQRHHVRGPARTRRKCVRAML
jgi:hypothetical protein